MRKVGKDNKEEEGQDMIDLPCERRSVKEKSWWRKV